jgi:RNA polymerase sigma-70 factor (ECF subfamily)
MISEHTFNQFKAGDMQVFGDIYSEFAMELEKFLLKHFNNITVEDAKDIVHDTFIRLLNKRTEVRSHLALFKYLCKTAKHIFFNKQNRNKIKTTDSLELIIRTNVEPQLDSQEDALIMREDLQHINCVVVKKLTKRQREVLNLWLQKLTYKEIAKKLGITPKTVETHIHQIFGVLRKYLYDYEKKIHFD